MVDFGKTNYMHAMDKDNSMDFSTRQFGSSAKWGDVIQGLKSELAMGASHVEIGFSGKDKGNLSGTQTTPEMFDKVKREEVRQLAKLNDVTLSTHATVQISGVSGWGERGFDDKAKNQTLQEIKRTIEFAADTAEGGAIVVHTNEFPRVVKDERFDMGEKKGEETVYLVERESGGVIPVQKSKILHLPEWQKNDKGEFVDIDGKVIQDPREVDKRVPVFDDKGQVSVKEVRFDDIKKEIDKWNECHSNEQLNPEKEFRLREEFQKLQMEEPRRLQYLREYHKMMDKAKTFKEEISKWQRLEKGASEQKMDYWKQALADQYKELAAFDMEDKKPSEILKEVSKQLQEEAVGLREGYVGFERHKRDLERLYRNLDTIEKVGVERSADTFAKAAMYAYNIEEDRRKKGNPLGKDMFIAPENMMAEWGYGSHPDDLKNIVIESRKAMVKMLVEKKGMDKGEAKKVAKSHIKATFDIGHANTWAKYFEEDPNLSPDENKKKFDKWLMGKVKELQKDDVLGHVHLSDNFGYYDEHLSVGKGNAPMKDFMKLLKDKKYEGDIIVEWGAQGPDEPSGAHLAAWANLAQSPIYRVEGVAGPQWSDIQGGYFGRGSSPITPVGRYATALGKDWQMWSYSDAPIE